MLGVLLALIAVTVGAAAQASVGFGLNLFAVPLLALIDPVFAPGPVLLLSFLLSVAASIRGAAHVERRELASSIGGLAVGTALAALVLTVVSGVHLPRLFGTLVLVAVGISLAGVAVPLTGANLVGAGVVAGIMGTLAGVHGPPIALVYQHADAARIRGAVLPFIAVANLLSLLALLGVGHLGVAQLQAALILLPGVVLGYLLAPLLSRFLDAGHVRGAVLAVSALSGLVLVVKG